MITNEQLFQYLEKKIPQFSKIRNAKTGKVEFVCPNCENHKFAYKKYGLSATFMPSGKIYCGTCQWSGSLYDTVRVIEPDYKNKTDAEITAHLIEELGLSMYKELDAYQKYGFAIIPLLQNSKVPFEKGWTESIHKDKVQQIKWLNNGLNIGIRTGEVSGITVIDFDNKGDLSEEKKKLKDVLDKSETLSQTTANGGYHYVFKYDKELAQTTNIGGLHIDIRNDGGQIVAAPSKININNYSWKNLGVDIKVIPAEIKEKILALIKTTVKEETIEAPKITNENMNFEGTRNSTLTAFLGWCVKQNIPLDYIQKIAYGLNSIIYHSNPLPTHEVKATIGSLGGFKENDESTYEKTIYEYMKLMQTDVTPKDIIDNTKLPRQVIDMYLSRFVKEGKVVRLGRGRYQYKEKIEWSDAVPEVIEEYRYRIPLFNHIAVFADGDVILLGGRPNDGKTTIALNILREVIKQDVKPYYVYSESGSRFQKTSQALEIAGKYFHTFHENPLAIELEYNSFTVIDWLCLENKAETDVVLKHLNNEVQRKRGILVIFTQLKEANEWFAPNLITHFPSFAARLFQDNPDKTQSHWLCDKVKEARDFKSESCTYIPCEFDPKNKIYKLKDIT